MTAASRESRLAQWFQTELPDRAASGGPGEPPLEPVSGDASFRRYFRVRGRDAPYILVDAPPEQERCETFVRIARRFREYGIQVPRVLAVDYEQGFMCLSDFGDTLLLQALTGADPHAAGALYRQAFDPLLKIQALPLDGDFSLPPFDAERLLREMHLFRDWFCERLLGLPADDAQLDRAFAMLANEALVQPSVCVHRDYHSRNLMRLTDGSLGVLDFQDAVRGPLTYDLVSLLKDCYVAWPREQVRAWAEEYRVRAGAVAGIPVMESEPFLRAFDLMGVQRHLKAVGIFSRLHLRDGKPAYLHDIPRTLDYIREVVPEHPALRDFGDWLDSAVMPALRQTLPSLLRDHRRA